MHPILADRRRLALHLLAWALVGGMLALLLRAWPGLAWTAALAFALPLAFVAAPVSLSAWYLCRALPLSRTSPWSVGTAAVVASFVTASLWALIGQWWWRLVMPSGAGGGAPATALLAVLLGFGVLAYLLSITVHYLLQGFEESAEVSQRALQSQIAAREAELRALRAQVDPHFLFNSLNSISGLIASEPDRARQMCQLLGDFLRDSLTLGAVARIPLGREMALAQQYLQVERVRFGARLRVAARIADDSAAVTVPPLILQPLVENAVRHGIATCLEGGSIDIDAARKGDLVLISVINPRDLDAGSRRGTGFGLDIVKRRLAASFGDRAAVAVETTPVSYRVTVTIPIEEERS